MFLFGCLVLCVFFIYCYTRLLFVESLLDTTSWILIVNANSFANGMFEDSMYLTFFIVLYYYIEWGNNISSLVHDLPGNFFRACVLIGSCSAN